MPLVAMTVYPLVLLLGVAGHLLLQQASNDLLVSTYIPVICAALLVTLLEVVMPDRKEWSPSFDDVKNDALYMIFIQLVLPRLLAFLFIVVLIEPIQSSGLTVTAFWPHQWPIAGQVILMMVSAEFFRYWLHRLAHEQAWLWRFHAVHHAPKKLYWFNVGRFHIVDKSLQFLFDVLPFMLLGVGEWVIGLYMVCYSLNGFFQHSNIKLKFGWLNYIVSTAELHRWHHSKRPEESNRNYGNNLILWDLIFGTWFLPKDKQVGPLGIKNSAYPQSFINQFKTPFVGEAQNTPLPDLSFREIIKNGVIAAGLWIIKKRCWIPLQKAATDPKATQEKVLQKIIEKNRDTSFGRTHNYSSIRNYEDFKKQVPVQTYETLRPFIEEQEEGKHGVTSDSLITFAQTSGTTADPKLIPITANTLSQLKNQQGLFSYLQYKEVPTAFTGKLLGIVGASTETHRDSGLPVGSVSGLMYQSMPSVIKSKYVLPDCVFDVRDYDLKYLLIARLALAEPHITYMNSANPTTFIKLMETINQHRLALIDDIKDGTFHRERELPEQVREKLAGLWKSNPARAEQLKAYITQYDELVISQCWPYLQLVATWVGGSCGVAIEQIKPQLAEHTRIMDIGYIATEFRGTVPLKIREQSGLPLIKDHFYEFVERNHWEQGRRRFKCLYQLDTGKYYYVFITTASGLVRYAMNDIVRVTGKYHRAPLFTFCQKGKGVTNITGEKLSEEQVIQSVSRVARQLGIQPVFYVLVAEEQARRYTLYIDTATCHDLSTKIAEDLEQALRDQNIEYASKRDSGRLSALRVKCLMSGAGDAYKRHHLERGQRESQFKVMILQYQKDLTFDFDSYLLIE